MKISPSNLFNYFSDSGDSKQKKFPTKKVVLCGGHHPKVPLFFDAAPYSIQVGKSHILHTWIKIFFLGIHQRGNKDFCISMQSYCRGGNE